MTTWSDVIQLPKIARLAILVSALTIYYQPAEAQSWPARVQEIVEALAAGVPHSAPDEERRAVTQRIAEQVRYELGPNWGWKRADPGRPLSTDVIATQFPFVGYDWSVPSGIARFPAQIDLTGQVFVPVEPRNHLALPDVGTNEPDPGRTEPDGTNDGSIDVLVSLMGDVQAEITSMRGELATKADVARVEQKIDQHAQQVDQVVTQTRGFVRKWLVERIGPVVGAVVAGWFARPKEQK